LIQGILIDKEQINQLRVKQKQATLAENSLDKLRDDENVWSCVQGGFFLQVSAQEMRQTIRNERKESKTQQAELTTQLEETEKALKQIDPYDRYKLQQQYLQE